MTDDPTKPTNNRLASWLGEAAFVLFVIFGPFYLPWVYFLWVAGSVCVAVAIIVLSLLAGFLFPGLLGREGVDHDH
jgi:hypothetical protein